MNPKKTIKRILVTTKLSPELHKKIKMIALDKDVRMYEVLEEAISDYAEKYGKNRGSNVGYS